MQPAIAAHVALRGYIDAFNLERNDEAAVNNSISLKPAVSEEQEERQAEPCLERVLSEVSVVQVGPSNLTLDLDQEKPIINADMRNNLSKEPVEDLSSLTLEKIGRLVDWCFKLPL